MRIFYNKDGYQILFDSSETEIYINANNIVEARQYFLDRMVWLFDSTVNERLQKTLDESMEDVKKIVDGASIIPVCESDEDHEWACIGISTEGLYYRCKKCNATKTYPVEDCRYTTTASN